MTSPSHVPPGFRFHPTEEELLNYYLKKKVTSQKIDLDVIREVDLNKLEPWDIQDKCRIGSTPQNDWYFFSHRDKKYPTGIRTNRATASGFWKATGRDKVIYASSKRIGMRKTLVFYKGRAPHGQKSDWIMHEYRHYDHSDSTISHPITTSETTTQEGWVVCRVFKKRNHCKIRESPEESMVNSESTASFFDSYNNGTLEQILQHIGSTCKKETKVNNNNPLDIKSVQLPQPPRPTCYSSLEIEHQQEQVINDTEPFSTNNSGYVEPPAIAHDWATLDQIVESQLIGQDETTKNLVCFNDPTLRSQPFPHLFNAHDQELQFHQHGSTTMLLIDNNQDYNSDIDLWSFDRSSSPSPPHTLNNGVMSTTACG